jgi:catechol 2,3-dioxygenase-like lactoylglutathione lyase family enzyme
MIVGLDHVQLAIPPGAEERARVFYVALLGMTELPKPEALVARGGLWLQSGPAVIHLGVEQNFAPARKAHRALAVDDLDALAQRLTGAGFEPSWDDNIPGTRRFHVFDPLGNRLEFIAANEASNG